MKIKDLVKALDFKFNLQLQESWDKSGLQTKIYTQQLTNIHYCLDVTQFEIEQAVAKDANFILTHHPLYISESARSNAFNVKIEKLLNMHQICVYAAHTNYDNLHDGLTFQLVKMLNWSPISNVSQGTGLICQIEPITLEKLVIKLRETFNVDIKMYKNNVNKVAKVAFINGSGDEFYDASFKENCDVLITGDISHHEKIEARDLGFNLIDLDHSVEKYAILDFKKRTKEILDTFNTML